MENGFRNFHVTPTNNMILRCVNNKAGSAHKQGHSNKQNIFIDLFYHEIIEITVWNIYGTGELNSVICYYWRSLVTRSCMDVVGGHRHQVMIET